MTSYLTQLAAGTDRIVILGCGQVSAAVQQVLLDCGVDARRLTIVDADDSTRLRAEAATYRGAQWRTIRLEPDGLGADLDELTSKGGDVDVIINLTYDVSTEQYLEWCVRRGVPSVDTSVEMWDPYDDWTAPRPVRTLSWRHAQLRAEMQTWGHDDAWPTMVVEHGANPGWVSHATRAALGGYVRRYADRLLRGDAAAVRDAWNTGNYAQVAQQMGVRVIQIAERDTQISSHAREPDEFVNTWSVDGFRSEGGAPAAVWLGTHDQPPSDWQFVNPPGATNDRTVCGPRPGMETLVRSYVPPFGQTLGCAIDHGEILSIGRALSVPAAGGGLEYSPTVCYAYWPCDAAVASIHALRAASYDRPRRQRIMTRDIVSGADHLGVLLLGDHGGLWHGSCLDIHETRRLVGAGHNATTLQVAGSVAAATGWALANPNRGLCTPDDIDDWEGVLTDASRWLGPMPFVAVPWTPSDGPTAPAQHAARGVDGWWTLGAFLA